MCCLTRKVLPGNYRNKEKFIKKGTESETEVTKGVRLLGYNRKKDTISSNFQLIISIKLQKIFSNFHFNELLQTHVLFPRKLRQYVKEK